jgi:predicted Zn-dependent peptidase
MNNYKIGKLVNGLEYIIIPNDKVESVCLSVAIRVGSNDEDERINGISHLLEHMLYKGNKRFSTKIELYKALDSIGAVYNAYTDKNITNFYVKCHYKYLEKLIQIFSSLICEPYVEEKDLVTERNIVIEEIMNNKDEPFDVIFTRFYKLTYDGYPISKKISGEPDNIRNITRDDIMNHLRKYYTSDNMVVSISGKIDENYERFLENSSFTKAPASLEKHEFREIIKAKRVTSVDMVHRKINQMYLGICFPTDGLYDSKKYAIKLIDLVLNGSMSSRLFIRLRETEGLVYSIGTDVSNYEEGGLYYIVTSFDGEQDKYKKVLLALFDEFKKLINDKLSEDELIRWKNYIKSMFVLELEDTMDICDYYSRQMLFFRDNILDFHELLDNFDKVTVDDIKSVANDLLDWQKMKVVLIGDYSMKAKEMVDGAINTIKESFGLNETKVKIEK